MVEVHCKRELKVAEEEINIKGEVEVGVMVESRVQSRKGSWSREQPKWTPHLQQQQL